MEAGVCLTGTGWVVILEKKCTLGLGTVKRVIFRGGGIPSPLPLGTVPHALCRPVCEHSKTPLYCAGSTMCLARKVIHRVIAFI